MHALENSEVTFCSQYALSASFPKTGIRTLKSGKISSSACVIRVLLPASSAALLTVFFMQGAQDGDIPSEQELFTINGAQTALEVLTEEEREGCCTGLAVAACSTGVLTALLFCPETGSLIADCLASARFCNLILKRTDLSLAQSEQGAKHSNTVKRKMQMVRKRWAEVTVMAGALVVSSNAWPKPVRVNYTCDPAIYKCISGFLGDP